MKKLTLSLFIFFSFLTIASAQEDQTKINTQATPARVEDNRSFRFGISVQPLAGWLRADTKNIEGQGIKAGISGGLIFENLFSKNASLCFGLLVSQTGGKLSYDTLEIDQNNGTTGLAINTLYNYSLRYVELPVTLKLKTEEIGYLTYFAELGVSPGLLWRARADVDPKNIFPEAEGGTDRAVNDKRDDFVGKGTQAKEDNIRAFRLPLVVGGGVEYALTESTRAIIGLRYNAGVTNIMRSDKTTAFNSYLSLNLGVLF